jgi:hypothetical protein
VACRLGWVYSRLRYHVPASGKNPGNAGLVPAKKIQDAEGPEQLGRRPSDAIDLGGLLNEVHGRTASSS